MPRRYITKARRRLCVAPDSASGRRPVGPELVEVQVEDGVEAVVEGALVADGLARARLVADAHPESLRVQHERRQRLVLHAIADLAVLARLGHVLRERADRIAGALEEPAGRVRPQQLFLEELQLVAARA